MRPWWTLRKLTRAENPIARSNAAFRLGEKRHARAVEPLICTLASDPDEYVRCSAAMALGKIGDSRAVEPLIQLAVKDPHLTLPGRGGSPALCSIPTLEAAL